MDKKTQQALIETYLADETKLYQDWYQAFYPPEGDTDTMAFGSSFSLEALKKRFQQWFEKQQEILQHQICQKWEYPKKKAQFKNTEALIIAISVDCLAIMLSLPTTNLLTVATILVADDYLDKLCP